MASATITICLDTLNVCCKNVSFWSHGIRDCKRLKYFCHTVIQINKIKKNRYRVFLFYLKRNSLGLKEALVVPEPDFEKPLFSSSVTNEVQ